MSILTAHLRSPEQRRSDNLTILTRRAPPPQTCGRFFKVSAENGVQVHSFDPAAFDSDAETDGPPSDSFAWRREHSRIRTSLSLNSLSSRLDTDSTPRRVRRSLTRGTTPSMAPFSRDRATSFYHGKSRLHHSVSNDDIIGAVNPQRLQQLLGEDYVLFCSSNAKTAQPPRQQRQRSNTSKHSRSMRSILFSSRRPGFNVSLVSAGSFRAESDEEKDVEQFSRMLVAERSNDDRPSCASIPLFVEEIGRVPRVAVVDGKARRVRARNLRGASYRMKPPQSQGSNNVFMQCFGICLHPAARPGEDE